MLIQTRCLLLAIVACGTIHASTARSQMHKVLAARTTPLSNAPSPPQICQCPSPVHKPPKQQITRPLPQLAPLWQQPLPKAAGNLTTIQNGYNKLLPELKAYHEAIEQPKTELPCAVDSLKKVEKCFKDVITQFGPSCGCSVEPGSKALFAFQKTFIQLFYNLQKIIATMQSKWPETYLAAASPVLHEISNTLQVLISLGLNLNIDVGAIFDTLDLHVFKDAKIDTVGLVLLSRTVVAKLHRGESF